MLTEILFNLHNNHIYLCLDLSLSQVSHDVHGTHSPNTGGHKLVQFAILVLVDEPLLST